MKFLFLAILGFPIVLEARPNVLVFLIDDLNTEFSTYGPTHDADGKILRALTPNVDSLAARGTVFERAVCQYPTCGGSRASFLSGLYPTQTGKYSNTPLSEREAIPWAVFLPQRFKQAGYTTVGINKVFHWASYASGLQDETNSWSRFHWESSDTPVPVEQGTITGNGVSPQGMKWASRPGNPMTIADGRVAARMITEINQFAQGDPPWLLIGGFVKPHLPWDAATQFFDLYPTDQIALPDTMFPGETYYDEFFPGATGGQIPLMGQLGYVPHSLVHVSGDPLPDEDAQTARRAYFACVSHVDYLVGEVMAALDASGQADDTIVIFMSDHGYQLGQYHKRSWEKSRHLPQSIWTPLIISAPHFKGGQRVGSVVELVDLYPTLLDLCYMDEPYPLAGESLVSLLADPDSPWDRPAFCELRKPSPQDSPAIIASAVDPETGERSVFIAANRLNNTFGLWNWDRDPNFRKNLMPYGSSSRAPIFRNTFNELRAMIPPEFELDRQIPATLTNRFDRDSDGVPDLDEINLGSSPSLTDTDGDQLTDSEERELAFLGYQINGDDSLRNDYLEQFAREERENWIGSATIRLMESPDMENWTEIDLFERLFDPDLAALFFRVELVGMD